MYDMFTYYTDCRKPKARQEIALSPFKGILKFVGFRTLFIFNWFIILFYIVSATDFFSCFIVWLTACNLP